MSELDDRLKQIDEYFANRKHDYIDVLNIEFLVKENQMLREEGMRLAEASMRVIRTYDGLHRLSKAVSRWCDAIAGEGGRKEMYERRMG